MRISLAWLLLTLFISSSQCVSAQNDKAMQLYEKALKQFRAGDSEKGWNLLEKSMDKAQTPYYQPFILAGDLLLKQGEYREAVRFFQQSLEVQPVSIAYLKMSYAYKALYEWDQAIAAYESYLGRAQFTPRRQEEAQVQLEQLKFAKTAFEAYVKDSSAIRFEKLGFSDEKMEYFPCITGDERGLIFTARNFSQNSSDENLYGVERINGQWGVPMPLIGAVNSTGNEGAATISPDGKFMVFTACDRPGGAGSCDLYYSYWSAERGWDRPKALEGDVNTQMWESQPALGPDGRTLYFVRGTSSSSDNIDIYVATWDMELDQWTQVQPLPAPINTSGRETAPFIHFDGKSLIFCAERNPSLGGTDFFISQKQEDGQWSMPQNLGMPYNSYGDEFSLVIAADGQTGYMASSRSGGLAEFNEKTQSMDLFTFSVPEAWRPEATRHRDAIVVNAKTRQPIGRARVRVYELESGEERYAGESRLHTGYVRMMLPEDGDFGFSAYAPGFVLSSGKLEQSASSDELLEIALEPLTSGAKFTLNNILFDLDESTLKPSSERELNLLLQWLLDREETQIKVVGHTDNQGSAAYNMGLSKRRAAAVVQWLVEHGIPAERLTSSGLGSTVPVASNDTPEGRALNRRTEIEVR